MTVTSGPSAQGDWELHEVGPGSAVLLRASGNGSNRSYCVSDRHRVVLDEHGYPQLALVLVLQGVPAPDETDVTARVRQGSLTLGTTVEPPAEALGRGVDPLYVRDGSTVLHAQGQGEDVATTPMSGTGLRATLSTTLDREEALAVMAALDGQGETLSLVSTLWYRAVTPGSRVELSGTWAEVHDVLAGQPSVSPPNLHRLFVDALASGALVASPADQADAAYATFAAMAKAVLLDAEGHLQARPSTLFGIDLVATQSGLEQDQTLTVMTPLSEVLGGCLDGLDRGRVISIVGLGGGSSAPGSGGPAQRRTWGVPRRVAGSPRTRSVDGAGRERPRLVLGSDLGLRSVEREVRASVVDRGSLHVELAKEAVRPWAVGVHAFAVDDQRDLGNQVEDLPVVSDPAAWVFDARGGAPRWYAPSFELILPVPSQDASSSPFVFSFRRAGTTLDGVPGLEATVRWEMRRAVGPEAQASLGGNGPYRPVATDDVQVVLDLPFRDSNGGAQRQRFPADVSWDGDVLTATVTLLDSWARMAYGAISQPGFQVEPARVSVAWSFLGCERVTVQPDDLVFGGKVAEIPIVYSDAKNVQGLHVVDPLHDPDPATAVTANGTSLTTATVVPQEVGYLDARTATFRSSVGDFTFRAGRSAPVDAGFEVRPTVQTTMRLSDVLVTGDRFRPGTGAEGPDGPRGGIDRPWFPHRVDRWMKRSYLRSQVLDLLVPCAELGACYVEQQEQELLAVGCRDALRLGQADWRQYDELPSLADPSYRVFRSLQQPGRFLVLPTRYVVGRYSPDHPSAAYQPSILLYALLDPERPENNHVAISATLVPDITPFAWHALERRLTSLAAHPVLTVASDVECRPEFTWTVVSIPHVTVPTVLGAGVVSVSVQSDLAEALQLRDMLAHTGIAGSMRLALPDGSTMTSALVLGLSDIAGPQPHGPLQLGVSGSTVQIVNRVERTVDVTSVRVRDQGDGVVLEHPVETTLTPGAAASVDLVLEPAWGVALTPDSLEPVYAVPPAAPAVLEELHTYVEDIRMSVLFMDLVDHEAHQVARLEVRAQLVDASSVQEVAMTGSPASGSAQFVLPLTAYLAQRQVRYQVTVTDLAGTARESAWSTWDAATAGNLIGLTWTALGLA